MNASSIPNKQSFDSIFLDHSQAGFVMWAAATFDNGLEDELIAKMKQLSNEMRKRIFKSYGPLANFAAKIDLCLAFDIISDKTYADLRALNKIRVEFAHTADRVRLQDKKLKDYLISIVGPLPDDAQILQVLIRACNKISGDIDEHKKQLANTDKISE